MGSKIVGTVECAWCKRDCRVGIELDGEGKNFRVACYCGANSQIAREYPSGLKIAAELRDRGYPDRGPA